MLPGGNVLKTHSRRIDSIKDGGFSSSHWAAPPTVCRHGCSNGDDGPSAKRTDLPRSVLVKASTTQLLGLSPPATNVTNGNGNSPAEVLRPRRFSAPAIARLIRSTTNLQELTDVVQQQLAFFDPAHVGIALVHLALLVNNNQQRTGQQQPAGSATAAAGPGAAPAGAAGPGPGPGGATAAAASAPASAGSDPHQQRQQQQQQLVGAAASGLSGAARDLDGAAAAASNGAGRPDDEDLGLLMSSILDDDEAEYGEDRETGYGGALDTAAGFGAGGRGQQQQQQQEGEEDLLTMSSILDDNDNDGGEGYGSPFTSLDGSPEATSSGLGGGADALGPSEAEDGSDVGYSSNGNGNGNGVACSSSNNNGVNGGQGAADAALVSSAAAATTATATAAGHGTSSISGSTGNGSSNSLAPSQTGPPLAATTTAAAAAATATATRTGTPAQLPAVAGLLRMLLPAVLSGVDEFRGSDLSAVLAALAVLRYGDRLVVERLLQAMTSKFSGCRPQDLSHVWCATALLGVQPDAGIRSALYSAVRRRAKRYPPRYLAQMVWAFGAVGCDVPQETLEALLSSSRTKLAAFSPLELTKMMQGLAALRWRPSYEWVEAFCAALRPTLRRMTSRELCALLLALASLQIALDDTTRATLLVHTLTSLPSLAPSELAASIWALGRLTAAGLPALIDLDTSGRVLDVTGATLGSFSGGELQQLLEGLTRLALQPPLDWMQAYVAALQPKLRELDARQLAGVLGSLAAQQYRPMPEMQEVVLAATQANMQQLLADTTCTASLVTALRRLNIEPPPSWVEALLGASRSALKNRCSGLHLANLAGSLAAWRVRPDGRWTARMLWRSQVLLRENRMSPRALAALLQAMTTLGIRPNAVWSALCLRAAAARAPQHEFEPQHYSTILASLHALGVQPPQVWLSTMLQSTYRCWDGFNMAHWSSLLPALVLLEARPPREWLRRLEATTLSRLANCSALQLLTLLVSLHQLNQLQASGAASTLQPPPSNTAPLELPRWRRGKAGRSKHRRQAVKATAGAEGTPAASPAAAEAETGAAAAGPASSALATSVTAAAPLVPVSLARPGSTWLAAWWASSTRLLATTRYAPSELALTAGWLATLELTPPPEWLQACADVAERYGKVMGPEERQQLAAALLPLMQGMAQGQAQGQGQEKGREQGRKQGQKRGQKKWRKKWWRKKGSGAAAGGAGTAAEGAGAA